MTNMIDYLTRFIEEFVENHPFIAVVIILTAINGLCGPKIEKREPDE